MWSWDFLASHFNGICHCNLLKLFQHPCYYPHFSRKENKPIFCSFPFSQSTHKWFRLHQLKPSVWSFDLELSSVGERRGSGHSFAEADCGRAFVVLELSGWGGQLPDSVFPDCDTTKYTVEYYSVCVSSSVVLEPTAKWATF